MTVSHFAQAAAPTAPSAQMSAAWARSLRQAAGLPLPMDSESRAMLRLFLAPILERATSWGEMAGWLDEKGYSLGFREGRLVVYNDMGEGLCTGSDIGVPMVDIVSRIGKPCIKAHVGGLSGELADAPQQGIARYA